MERKAANLIEPRVAKSNYSERAIENDEQHNRASQ